MHVWHATRDSARAALINGNATVFAGKPAVCAAKPAVFLRPGQPSDRAALRLAGAGGSARFQGEDVRKMRIRGWANEKRETKRRPEYVLTIKKSTKTTLFRVIDWKQGSCPKIAYCDRAKTSDPPGMPASRGNNPSPATAVLPYQRTLRPPAGPRGDPRGESMYITAKFGFSKSWVGWRFRVAD